MRHTVGIKFDTTTVRNYPFVGFCADILRVIRFAIALSLLLSSDVTSKEMGYPTGWPEVKAAENHVCVPLTGLYQYVAENVKEGDLSSKYFLTMAYAFGGYTLGKFDENATVELMHLNENTELSALFVENRLPAKSSTKLFNFSCVYGWWVSESATSVSAEGGRAKYKTVVRLAKATDGSLIIYNNYEGTSSQFFGLFPNPFTNETWFRFLPIRK